MNALGGQKHPILNCTWRKNPRKEKRREERNQEESAASREEGIRRYKHFRGRKGLEEFFF